MEFTIITLRKGGRIVGLSNSEDHTGRDNEFYNIHHTEFKFFKFMN